jgi:regulator of sigma E protease
MMGAIGGALVGFFASMVVGGANFSEVAGPIGIAGIGSAAVTAGVAATVILTALISINLAFVNLLPIPGLDGGRLLIIAIEAIRGRPISPRFILPLTAAGMILLVVLIVLVSFQDIARLID